MGVYKYHKKTGFLDDSLKVKLMGPCSTIHPPIPYCRQANSTWPLLTAELQILDCYCNTANNRLSVSHEQTKYSDQLGPNLAPLEADLVLVLLHPHVGVDAAAADEFKVRESPIRLDHLDAVDNSEIVARVAVQQY